MRPRRAIPDSDPPAAPDGDAASDRFEVQDGPGVVGPLSREEMRRGISAGWLLRTAPARRVTPWLPVRYVTVLHAPPGQDRHPCLEVRCGDDVRGPVSLYQVRRGLAAAVIPDGTEARVVWRWQTVEQIVDPRFAV